MLYPKGVGAALRVSGMRLALMLLMPGIGDPAKKLTPWAELLMPCRIQYSSGTKRASSNTHTFVDVRGRYFMSRMAK